MSLPYLNKTLVNEVPHLVPSALLASMDRLPERLIQFGEGAFLRGFVDWMIDCMNRAGLFNGRVVVVQPLPTGRVDDLNHQDGLYTLLLRGTGGGKRVETQQVISSISRGIDPYRDYPAFLRCGENPDLRFVVSNTTEAGIVFNAGDRRTDSPPASFPGKLAALLYARFRAFGGDAGKGLVVLPCELIERNGDTLKTCVLQTADSWQLGAQFTDWVSHANCFANTLVDRIVTGYPEDEAEALFAQLGYQDGLLDAGETSHSWVIEGPTELSDELPFHRAGLNVTWTENLAPYHARKVRILNGGHTMIAPAAFLMGKQTVKESIEDAVIAEFLRDGLYEEIIPTLDLPPEELESFAAAVLERFANPFISHKLLGITLNATSKFKTRLLPSIKEYVRRKGSPPRRLAFALAALIALYRGKEIRNGSLTGCRDGEDYKVQDSPEAMEIFRRAWGRFDRTPSGAELVVRDVLAREALWGEDLNGLPGFARAVAGALHRIVIHGIRAGVTLLPGE